MKLCVASYKPVWRCPDAPSGFATDGGFPYQMEAISSLFDQTELLVCERPAPAGRAGTPLPRAGVRVIPLPEPRGADGPRKLFLAATAGYYVARLAAHVARADAVHAVVPGDIGMFGMVLALAMRKRLFVRYCSSWPETAQTTRMNRLCKRLMVRHAGGRSVMFATGLGHTPPDGPGGRMQWIFSTSLRLADLEALERVPAQRVMAASTRCAGGGGPCGGAGPRGETAPGHCRLLYAGRLSPEKGLLILLEALTRLQASGRSPDLSLTLAGHGPQLNILRERTATLGLGERVRFSGLLDRPGVLQELAAADLFVLPSLTEGFPKALVEAMAAGVPAIASGVGAIPMILGSDAAYGLVVPPGNVEALADALATLAADPDRRNMIGLRAQQRAREWTLEAWADQMGAILEEAWGLPLKAVRREAADARMSA